MQNCNALSNAINPYPRPEPQQAQQAATEEDILDANFAVQLGEKDFPTFVQPLLAQQPRPYKLKVSHSNPSKKRATWTRNMIDRYPYYDDGPKHTEQEQWQHWDNCLINTRNQISTIRPPEPANLDLQRSGENATETRKIRDSAAHEVYLEDSTHDPKLDATHRDYDAQYSAHWRAQRERIEQNNTNQQALELQNRRAFDKKNNPPASLDTLALEDEREELAQVEEPESDSGTPKPTRCTNCKARKKKCDLAETRLPCTNCRRRKVHCVGCDIPRRQVVRRKTVKATPKPDPRTSPRPATGQGMAATPTLAPASEPQEVDPKLFRRNTARLRPRSASPQREELSSDKCDNCKRHGRRCDDARPCYECMSWNLVCTGSYMDNPYRFDGTEDGPDEFGNGWGTFGQNFGFYD
jgi:Fungal Zn(2)-Cys(6) binuclear cluster domain